MCQLQRPHVLKSPTDASLLSPFLRNRVYMLFDTQGHQLPLQHIKIIANTENGQENAIKVPVKLYQSASAAIHKLGARAILGDLERGHSWIQSDPNRPSRHSAEELELIRSEGELLGCKWALVSKWTSFYAVDEPYEPDRHEQDPFMDVADGLVQQAEEGLDLLRPRGDPGQHVDGQVQGLLQAGQDMDVDPNGEDVIPSNSNDAGLHYSINDDSDSDSEDGGDGGSQGGGQANLEGAGEGQRPQPDRDNLRLGGTEDRNVARGPQNEPNTGAAQHAQACEAGETGSATELSEDSPLSPGPTSYKISYGFEEAPNYRNPYLGSTARSQYQPAPRSPLRIIRKFRRARERAHENRDEAPERGFPQISSPGLLLAESPSPFPQPSAATSLIDPFSYPRDPPYVGYQDLELQCGVAYPTSKATFSSHYPSSSFNAIWDDVANFRGFQNAASKNPSLPFTYQENRFIQSLSPSDTTNTPRPDDLSAMNAPSNNLSAASALILNQTSAPKSEEEQHGERIVQRLVQAHQSDGSFDFGPFNTSLKNILGDEFLAVVDAITNEIPKSSARADTMAILIAIVTLFELRLEFCQELWSMIASKAKTWIDANFSKPDLSDFTKIKIYDFARHRMRSYQLPKPAAISPSQNQLQPQLGSVSLSDPSPVSMPSTVMTSGCAWPPPPSTTFSLMAPSYVTNVAAPSTVKAGVGARCTDKVTRAEAPARSDRAEGTYAILESAPVEEDV